MAKSIPASKNKRGRPKTTGIGTQIVVRIHEPLLSQLDAFIADEPDSPSRPEAVRRLLADDMVRLGYLKPD